MKMATSLPQRLVVMYHSVSGAQPAVTGSFPIGFERFIHQIRLLQQCGYALSAFSEWEKQDGQRRAFITSDDGTMDWALNVLPWCEENRIPTLTSVITGVWEDPPVYPLAHVLQVVLALRPRHELENLAERLWAQVDGTERAYINRVYAYETDPVRRRIKGACNLVLEENVVRSLLAPLTEQEQEALSQCFAAADYYGQFEYAQLAMHTRSHAPLGHNAAEYFEREIKPCMASFEHYGLDHTGYFVSPMKPRPGASYEQLVPLLKQRGFKGLLISEYIENLSDDFLIPRVDANQLEAFLGHEYCAAVS